MTVDDFSAPLGQEVVKRRRRMPIEVPHVIAGALALFFALFVLWVIVGDGSFGGPTATVPIERQAVKVSRPEPMPPSQPVARAQTPAPAERPTVTEVPVAAPPPANPAAPAAPAAGTRTVTIIDGQSGTRREVVIPAAPPAADEPAEKPVPTPPPGRRNSN